MRYFITGCAGFIGSSLVDRLLQDNHEVIGYDNFSTGFHSFLQQAKTSPRFSLVEADLLDQSALNETMQGSDLVIHLAANADVRFGTQHPHKDLEQNTLATFHVLEAMRANQIKRIAFASTASIYGEATLIPTPENVALPIQTSLYGASKLAAEGLIQAYCAGFDFQAHIFRFVSILGERYTHGHAFDFYKQLLKNPGELAVLGNGQQKKSYLYIQDCIDAMLLALTKAKDKVNIFNLGTDEYCQVNDSIGWISDYLHLNPKRQYSGGDRGWVGDNPFILLDCSRMKALGWQAKLSIREALIRTLAFLESHPHLMEERREIIGT